MMYSVVSFADIKTSPGIRMDAEYWRSVFIKNSRLVPTTNKIKHFISKNVSNIKSSPINKNFDYLEISKISLENPMYETIKVQKGEEPDRAHYILRENDVVVSTVRPNRNAVAFIDRNNIIGSSGLSVLRSNGEIEPEYFFVFCKTDYFINCLIRANKATMYPAVSNEDILNLPMFIPSKKFRKIITQNIKKAFFYIAKAKDIFVQTENMFLSELDLVSWKPQHKLTFIKDLYNIKQTQRMDAEYFQPKYEKLIHNIKHYKEGWDTLGNLISLKDDNFKPKENHLYKYIELSHISSTGEIIKHINSKGQNLPSRAKRKISKGDIIISSVEGSLSQVALIDQEYDNGLCSTGFYVINSKKLNSETVFLIMKSIIGQLQLKKGCSGIILSAINTDQFQKIILPKISISIQKQIKNNISQVVNLRKQAKHLLKHSVLAVETAIKKNEKTAISWLANHVSKYKEIC